MKNHKRYPALLMAILMVVSPLAGCSKSKDTSAEDAEATVTSYMDNLIAGKANKNSKLVIKGDDAVSEIDLPEDQMTVLEALISCATYEITASDVSSDSGKGDVTIELSTVDLDEVFDEDVYDATSASDMIEELSSDAGNLITEELTVKVKQDDEDWLITGAGTEIVADYLVSLVEEVSFFSISEEEALDVLRVFYTHLQNGEFDEAAAMCVDPDVNIEADGEISLVLAEFMFSEMTYEPSLVDISTDSVSVTSDIVVPDISLLFQTVYNDRALMEGLMADLLYAGLYSLPSEQSISTANRQALIDALSRAYSAHMAAGPDANVSFTQNVIVVRDDNGELKVDPQDVDGDLFEEPGMSSDLEHEYMPGALTLLYEDQRLDAGTAGELYFAYAGVYPDWYQPEPTPGQFPGGLDDDGRDPEEILLDHAQYQLFNDPDAPAAPTVSNEPYVFTDDGDKINMVYYEDINGNEVADFSTGMELLLIHINMKDPLVSGPLYLYDVYRQGEYIGTSYTTVIGDYAATNDLYLCYGEGSDSVTQGDYIFVVYERGGTRDEVLTTISFIVYEGQGW